MCDEKLEDVSSEEENKESILLDQKESENEFLDAGNGEDSIFAATYQFERVKTSIDISFKTLCEMYPDENFDDIKFQNIYLPKYLTSEVTKFEFFLMHNQWGTTGIAQYPMRS